MEEPQSHESLFIWDFVTVVANAVRVKPCHKGGKKIPKKDDEGQIDPALPACDKSEAHNTTFWKKAGLSHILHMHAFVQNAF